MLVILARHGNTFDPGDATCWVGARTDLPLVAKGREQAQAIGHALAAADLVPARTLAGPLSRTRETARLALDAAGRPHDPVEVDGRLREIDYGAWEGQTTEAIRAAGGGREVERWDALTEWPTSSGWPSSPEEHLGRVDALLRGLLDRPAGPILVVSSNGIFKLLGAAISKVAGPHRMATGHLALVDAEPGGMDIRCWNVPPSALREHGGVGSPRTPA